MDDKSLNNRIYTKFTRHVDNAGEVVSANHINKVQNAVTDTEEGIIKLHDSQFMDKVMFSFDNNLYTNSLFADEVYEKKYLDLSLSNNIFYNEKERSLSIDNNSITGELLTTKIYSSLGEGTPLNDFFLMIDGYFPVGSNVKYYIITDKNESYPIKANEPKLPCHIMRDVISLRVKIVMTKNAMNESPKIYALALLFFDPAVEAQYGLVNPDLRRFDEIHAGLTTLIRDRAQKDKLVKVIEPTSVVELLYNPDETLNKVITTSEKCETKTTETLAYGDYLNSENITEKVLLSILSTTENLHALPNDYTYKFFK